MSLPKVMLVLVLAVWGSFDGVGALAAAQHGGGSHCNTHHRCTVGQGTTIPDCKGPHKGPNGVMIQCK